MRSELPTSIALACCALAGGDAASAELETLELPPSLHRSELTAPLDTPVIRALQPWLDDASFEVKWQGC